MGTMRGGYIYRSDPSLLEMNAAILAERPSDGKNGIAIGRTGRPVAPCGTEAAKKRHTRRGEICPVCRRIAMENSLDASRRGAATVTAKRKAAKR